MIWRLGGGGVGVSLLTGGLGAKEGSLLSDDRVTLGSWYGLGVTRKGREQLF